MKTTLTQTAMKKKKQVKSDWILKRIRKKITEMKNCKAPKGELTHIKMIYHSP